MTREPAVFDARPFQRRHEEPFAHIMKAVAALEPGQGLRLLNTFDPRPLEAVMAAKGFDFEARQLGPEDWEVVFLPRAGQAAKDGPPLLDNRGVPPAEAGIRTLQTLRRVPASPGLVALFDRDPALFAQELGRRGYVCEAENRQGEGWRLVIRTSD